MEPVFKALKGFYGEKAEFIVADFDVEETFELLRAQGYDVPYIPMFFFIDAGGEVVVNEAGVFSFEEMAEFTEQIF